MNTVQTNTIRTSELARKANLERTTLKFYIEKGLLVCKEKTKGGYRLFNEREALDILSRIKKLKEKRQTIAEIKELVAVKEL